MQRSTMILIVAGTQDVASSLAESVVSADAHMFATAHHQGQAPQATLVCAATFSDVDHEVTMLRGDALEKITFAVDMLLVVWVAPLGSATQDIETTILRQLPAKAPPQLHTILVPPPQLVVDPCAAATPCDPTSGMTLVANVRRDLFAFAASQYMAQHPMMPMETTTLTDAPWYVTSGNVRQHPSRVDCVGHPDGADANKDATTVLIVDPQAIGHEGDLVLGLVYPAHWRLTKSVGATEGAVVDAAASPAKAVHVVDGGANDDMYFNEPFMVLAPLGNRESSTHVSGSVPPEGVQRGRDVLHWIGGESGLVGVLSCEGAQGNRLAETSVEFNLQGVVRYVQSSAIAASASFHQSEELQAEQASSSRPLDDTASLASPGASPTGPASPLAASATTVNLLQLARTPRSTVLNTPIVCIAGTSAEAGKTTLASKLIGIMATKHHLRVGAVKATGTGGVPDCRSYKRLGACVAFDQVDAGLPTTYTSPTRVEAYLGRSFLLCQDAGVDVIVVELGGDIIWANNPTLLAMPLLCSNLHRLFVLCNDTMSAIGVLHWLSGGVTLYQPAARGQPATMGPTMGKALAPRPRIPSEKLVLVASPFRSSLGAVQRAQAIDGMPIPMDPNDCEAMENHLVDLLAKEKHGGK